MNYWNSTFKVKKRGAIKRIKPLKPLKRVRLDSIGKLKQRLWEACKNAVRSKYALKTGGWKCYTCDRELRKPQDAQTGHFIPSSVGGASLRYHLDNLRIQCYSCNIHHGGMGAEFYRRLLHEIGSQRVEELFELKKKIVKADRIFYGSKIAEII